MDIKVIFQGFPGKMSRGYMGWSSVVYVDTGKEKIVFDTGGYGERSELPKRFRQYDIDMSDIDILVLSHFHHDHVINYDYFKNAKILMHKKEVDWVLSEAEDWPMPRHLFPVVEKTGRLELIHEDTEILQGIQTLLSPGHTPGCMALVLRGENIPTTVLAGDAVKNMNEMVTGQVDMSWDNLASAQSIKKIRDIANVVIPGHDRTLQVIGNKIVASTACHETIVVPNGVAHENQPLLIELKIESNEFTLI